MCLTRAARAASSALRSSVCCSGTGGARMNSRSTPLNALLRLPGSERSPTTGVASDFNASPLACDRTRARGLTPAAASCLTRLEPMLPVAPTTRREEPSATLILHLYSNDYTIGDSLAEFFQVF